MHTRSTTLVSFALAFVVSVNNINHRQIPMVTPWLEVSTKWQCLFSHFSHGVPTPQNTLFIDHLWTKLWSPNNHQFTGYCHESPSPPYPTVTCRVGTCVHLPGYCQDCEPPRTGSALPYTWSQGARSNCQAYDSEGETRGTATSTTGCWPERVSLSPHQDKRRGVTAALVSRKTNYDPSFCAQLIQLRIGCRPVTKNNSLVFTMSGMTRCAASERQHGTRDNCQ